MLYIGLQPIVVSFVFVARFLVTLNVVRHWSVAMKQIGERVAEAAQE
jgi:hypothetical protein